MQDKDSFKTPVHEENMMDKDSHTGVADVLQGSRGCEVSESQNLQRSTVYCAE